MARSTPSANRLDVQLCFALYRATNAITRLYRAPLAAIGLTYLQYLVLLVLWEQEQAQSVGSLAERLDLDVSTLTPLLKRMEAAGWVQRRRDPDDQRVVRVAVTAAGRRLRGEAARIQHQVACATGLDTTTFEALRSRLHTLASDLAEATPKRSQAVQRA